MDIKIGKRTWDPLANCVKIQSEEVRNQKFRAAAIFIIDQYNRYVQNHLQKKYEACKSTLGLCIPGFQVYSVRSGVCKRFGKEYGKNLNATSIKTGLLELL